MVAEPLTTRRIWTVDEVRDLDDDVRRELHDGEIWITPSPTLNHQDIIGKLYLFLSLWSRQHGGKAFLSPIDLYISDTTYYIPDLVFYSAAQIGSGEVERDSRRLRVAPALIVEVLSPSTARNDRTVKTRAYAAFGITHYWIVDPAAQTLEAFELRDGTYFVAGTLNSAETYQPSGFPGLQVVGSELFSDQTDSE